MSVDDETVFKRQIAVIQNTSVPLLSSPHNVVCMNRNDHIEVYSCGIRNITVGD